MPHKDPEAAKAWRRDWWARSPAMREKIKREELNDGQECALAGDRDGATLHRYAASFAADFVDRLSALLPKPAPQEEVKF